MNVTKKLLAFFALMAALCGSSAAAFAEQAASAPEIGRAHV